MSQVFVRLLIGNNSPGVEGMTETRKAGFKMEQRIVISAHSTAEVENVAIAALCPERDEMQHRLRGVKVHEFGSRTLKLILYDAANFREGSSGCNFPLDFDQAKVKAIVHRPL
jgi:hypothetical protein